MAGSHEENLAKIQHLLSCEMPDIGLQYYGVATQITDIQNFFIVPNSIYNMMSVLEKPGALMENINEADRVIYYSCLQGHYVRGAVRKCNPNGTYTCFALDYGSVDMEVEAGYIFSFQHKEEANIPGLAQYCELVMCFPRGGGQFTPEAVETFKFFMGQKGEKLLVTIKEMTSYKMGVEIMSSNSNPDTVSTVLAYTNHSSWYPGPLRVRPQQQQQY